MRFSIEAKLTTKASALEILQEWRDQCAVTEAALANTASLGHRVDIAHIHEAWSMRGAAPLLIIFMAPPALAAEPLVAPSPSLTGSDLQKTVSDSVHTLASGEESQPQPEINEKVGPEPQLSKDEIIEQIKQLEVQLMILKRAAGVTPEGKKIALPKNGIYVQGDIGLQQREFAGENGITNLTFEPGLYGGVGIGYRYDRNFRFSFEYSTMQNAVSKIRPGIPIPVEDPVVGPVGNNGARFPANGDVKLDSYTVNVYYDLNGFGYERRFRPYIGAGVGLMTSKISGLQPAFFPSIGVDRKLDASDTQPVLNFEAGISYLLGDQMEFYLGGRYTYTSTFLFEDTSFGTLMPNGARNWTIKTGARYTF
ncbi:outer membrane protein [Cyanobium sp. CH-040]|uniref:outer membrane protein n=1 Tax=Cyanobium sp. CH-040 TaxID=2823708 RepID=UPI0020CE9145|nr:outer membrane beta-barrel protein [Cyanobium sp. CH-040]MCP9926697.1 porin family protein [Cyanobium sp. CH-040]